MIWLYNIVLTFSSLFWTPWMLWRAKRRKEAVNWKERAGDYPFQLKKGEPRLWLHAVSVGEVVAALPILRAVRELNPDLEIVLSVTTSSGHQTAQEQASEIYNHLVYYPIDVYRFVLVGLVRVRPTVFAVMETELWLNFLDAAKNIDVKTLLINGRISDRSFPRARKFAFFYKDLFNRIDRCLVQTETDAERVRELGGQNVEVFGNCKFDQAVEGLEADPDFWRTELGIDSERLVIVVGSTRGAIEEKLVLDAMTGIDCQVVWAPRHLERVEALEAQISARDFSVVRRSEGGKFSSPSTSSSPNFLILDTYGELSKVYSVADVVVIGGGFDDLGGQNLIQPLAHSKPVIHGPHMHNFRDVSEIARKAGATLTARTSAELHESMKQLLADTTKRKTMGACASQLVQANVGASRRYAEAITEAVSEKYSSNFPKPT